MKCADCEEEITTYELRDSRQCHYCHTVLHFECVMVTPKEDDVCEPCFHAEHARHVSALEAMGVDDGLRKKGAT